MKSLREGGGEDRRGEESSFPLCALPESPEGGKLGRGRLTPPSPARASRGSEPRQAEGLTTAGCTTATRTGDAHGVLSRSPGWRRGRSEVGTVPVGQRSAVLHHKLSHTACRRTHTHTHTHTAAHPTLTFPTLITFFTASEIKLEWNSKLGRGQCHGSGSARPPSPAGQCCPPSPPTART